MDPAPDGSPVDTEIAAAKQEAVETDDAVVIDSLTDAFSTTSALPNGNYRREVSSEPVRVEQDDQWVPIDPSLALDGGVVRPAAVTVPVELSAGGSGPLVRVQAESGEWLSETWSEGILPAPVLDGATATYTEVLAGVDLRVTASGTGVTQVLVVKTPAAAANPALDEIRLALNSALEVQGSASGAATATAPGSDDPALESASPSFWDSSAQGSGAAGPGADGQSRPVPAAVSDAAVVLDVGAALSQTGLQYPVYVDPDWHNGQGGYTYVDNAYPTQNYWNGSGADDTYGHVGYVTAAWSDDNRSHLTRTFWRFGMGGLAGKRIIDAKWNGNGLYSSSCTKTPVEMWRTVVVPTTATWNAQPQWIEKLATLTDAFGYNSSCPTHPVGFNVTNGVQDALAAGDTWIGLGARATNESDPLSWKKFRGDATLVVEYNTAPTEPVGLSVGGCKFVCISATRTTGIVTKEPQPTLTGKSTDADGDPLRYRFQVIRGGGGNEEYLVDATSGQFSSGASAHYNMNVSLPDGADYRYRVVATDGVNSGPWSDWVGFIVDTVAPLNPVVSVVTDVSTNPDGFAGSIGETPVRATASARATSDRLWGYTWDVSPRGQVNSPSGEALTCPPPADRKLACVSSVNGSFAIPTFTVPSAVSTLTVWAFDAAGNSRSSGTSVDFFAADSTVPRKGHQWSTENAGASTCSSVSVVDLAIEDQQTLTARGNACLTAPTKILISQLATPVLRFNGTSQWAESHHEVVDVTGNFSVAAWVKPASVGVSQAIISQDGDGRSAFSLQLSSANKFRFCVPESTTGPYVCATYPATIAAGEWWYVTGVYDRSAHEIRVTVSNDGTALVGPDSVAPMDKQLNWPRGKLAVGRGQGGGVNTNFWDGDIFLPTVMPGTASGRQLREVGQDWKTPAQLCQVGCGQ